MAEVQNKIQRYESYKESGVEWLEEVPEHWEVGRLGSILNPVSSKNHPNKILLSITREKGVIVRDMENLDDNHNFIPDDLTGYKLLKEGQFGMNKMKAWQGSYGVSNYTGIVSPAYYTFEFTKDIDPRFFHIAIRSKLYVSFFGKASDGVRIGQWDLSKDRMKRIPLAIPPLPEQTKIAQFLDDKTTKIEDAIAIKVQQINLLKERKQILIHKAVTRGLDDSVTLKDSGVDWIGEIPEGWEVKALKFISNLQSGEFISSDDFRLEGYPVYGGNGFRAYAENYTNEGHFALIGRQGALCGNVNYAEGKFYATEHAVVVYPLNNEDTLWLGETIKVANFNRLSQSAAQPGIAVGVIKNERFPYPPISEQKEISAYIATASKKIETAIGLKQQEIAKLKEYKSSLINGVVTGKVRVC